jgi:hypothetical protein
MPVIVGRDAIRAAAALNALASSAHPYFVPAHAALLYLWSPLVAASACVLLLTPGLLISVALGVATDVGRWLLMGLTISIGVVSASAAIVQALMRSPLRGGAFIAVVCACFILSAAALLWRVYSRPALSWPLDASHSRATLATLIVVPLMMLVALTPKFYWENFNGDGAHAYESARLLLFEALPFWPPAAGDIASFPDIRSCLFAFPSSWFIRLFGELEVSARLPLLLYLPALFGALLALIEFQRSRPLGMVERCLLWLALTTYLVVMGFSATYNPYCADLALPATQDTLLMACYAGFVLAFCAQQFAWIWIFSFLTYLSLPNGIMLIGLWLIGVFLLWKPRPWREGVHTVAALAACAVIATIAVRVLALFNMPLSSGEYNAVELLNRYKFLWFSDWRRIAYVAAPCGFIPAVALILWRRQDRISRALTFVVAAYFLSFYIQAFIAIHHFVPCMILPLIVFWRMELAISKRSRRWFIAATATAGVAAFAISWPDNAAPDVSARLVGSTIEDRIGGYDSGSPAVFKRAGLLANIVPYDWDPSVPEHSFGGSPLMWNYYAHRAKRNPAQINYVMERAAASAPPGMHVLGRKDDVALYVASDAVLRFHRTLKPPSPAGAALYAIPRNLLFREAGPPSGAAIVDLRAALKRSGIDTTVILNRLGVRR